MAAVHFGRLSGNGLDLDADLLSFLGAVDGFMVHLDARHDSDVHELRQTTLDVHFQTNQTLPGLSRPFLLRLTPLLGTQSGVPVRRTPASMVTPITMGSLELKMN